MEIIKVNPGSNVFLGRQGENLAREIVFSIAPWVETYGQGNAQLLYRRKGDRDPYLVAVRQEGSEVHWSVSKPDTDVSGAGFYELHYYSGQTLVKSATGDTFVEGTMTSAMETPDPYKSWVDQVIEAAQSVPQTVEDALQEAKESGEFDGPKGDKGDQGDSAYDVAVKNGYEGTEEEWIADLYGKAVEAQKKAETAQFLAELEKRYAEEAAVRADLFAGQAKTSETNAKASEEKARVSAQNAEIARKNLDNTVEVVEKHADEVRVVYAETKFQADLAKDASAKAFEWSNNAKSSANHAERNATQAYDAANRAIEAAKNAAGIKTINGQKPDENGNIEIEVGSGSGVEVTAKPGQLIRVKETDENGKPTAWEAVPWGYTEGETIHPIPGELLPEGVPYVVKEEVPLNFTFDGDITGKETINTGGAMLVKVSNAIIPMDDLMGATATMSDGMVMEVTADNTFDILGDGSIIGNDGFFAAQRNCTFSGISFTAGLYFVYMESDGFTMYLQSLVKEGATVMCETVHKLDAKFLPDNIGGNGGLFVVLADTSSMTADKTADEILEAMLEGKTVLLASGNQVLPCVGCEAGQGAFFLAIGAATSTDGYYDVVSLGLVWIKPDGSIVLKPKF